MKKKDNLALRLLILTFLLSIGMFAQEDPKPVFITVTTLHRNLDTDMKNWKETEQEYFDKVTSKNDLIIGSEILNHYFTENSTEVLLISVFRTWEDIKKANDVSDELIKKGWPDEKIRKDFFDKYNTYYSKMHSDEIYSSIGDSKEFKPTSKEPMVVYIRKSQMTLNGQGKGMKEFNEKITMNNPYIKGYYPNRHSWGADSRDFLEAYYYDSLSDLEKSSDKQNELIKTAWPKEEDRKVFFEGLNKAFTGIHGDFIYHNEPTLSK
jgi:hypothetical protein